MTDAKVFALLFRAAFKRCFFSELATPLTDAESKHFSLQILEQTGLVIGEKSLRNYSLFVLEQNRFRRENPSLPTLDTLARYVLQAPRTDEASRKLSESHYPYWHKYRQSIRSSAPVIARMVSVPRKGVTLIALVGFVLILTVIVFVRRATPDVIETFDRDINPAVWHVHNMDSTWWTQRNQHEGMLTLFTLGGDNWDPQMPLRNILYRELTSDCFAVELQMSRFVPVVNWQQAGLILSENPTFTGRALRLSLSYNDFFGGYVQPPEILLQGVVSYTESARSRPEEIAHYSLFSLDSVGHDLAVSNLAHVILKIERDGNRFRLLYRAGTEDSFAFREVTSGEFDIDPAYVGIYSSQGSVTEEQPMPVAIKAFNILYSSCK